MISGLAAGWENLNLITGSEMCFYCALNVRRLDTLKNLSKEKTPTEMAASSLQFEFTLITWGEEERGWGGGVEF